MPHTDTDKYASFAHKRHLCGNCRKWLDTDEKVVCDTLAGWTPTLKGDQLWMNKAMPKSFAGKVTEMVANLSVLPKGSLDQFNMLFKCKE